MHDIQENEGPKFGNKLSKGHVIFHRHKMNVKIAAQTFSSSVADALEFLMKSGHPAFEDAEGTIRFIRIIDRLFDLLNIRNPFGKGYKKPLFLHDKARWLSVIEESINYLINLTTDSDVKLIQHRRKTFVLGLVLTAIGIRDLSIRLLSRSEDPFKYILTYKVSEDHVELLFACIRGKNGYNNNPDVRQLKGALKRFC